jgi:hypothetical protein
MLPINKSLSTLTSLALMIDNKDFNSNDMNDEIVV